MVEEIFFNSSLPRSGSTLIQNILGTREDMYVTPTDGTLELVYSARASYSESPEFKAQDAELMRKGFASFCHDGIYGWFNAVTDKKYVVSKSRGWGIYRPFLETFVENPKVICMVRDLRDVFNSYEKIYRRNPDKHDAIVNHANMTGTSTPKRIDIWANSQPIGLAIERLAEIIRQGYDSKILFVKYEDLCLHPENELFRIEEYLGIPHVKYDFDNIPQITQEDDNAFGIEGLHTIRHKVEPLISDAKQVLGRDVTNWIFDNYKWFYDYFRYSK